MQINIDTGTKNKVRKSFEISHLICTPINIFGTLKEYQLSYDRRIFYDNVIELMQPQSRCVILVRLFLLDIGILYH